MRYKWNYQDELAQYEEEYQPVARPRRRARTSRAEVVARLVEQRDDARQGFDPSFGSKSAEKFNVSRHEREWIVLYLSSFYEDHYITDVLKPVKGGKEATVYCCTAGPQMGVELLAAKLYRPRMFRNLRNDSLYRMGRTVLGDDGKRIRNRREALAMAKKTRFGQDLRHMNWLSNEVSALETLHDAGADVPRIFASNENAILMEFVGDADWPAPTLASVSLSKGEARTLFERVLHNVELMLEHSRVHGDLSAHNILYLDGDITLIDFPQVVDPDVNPYARAIFGRDVLRICQYFERFGAGYDPARLADSLWVKHRPLDNGEMGA
ncbi:MAG TPA: RIO1 family regulatory kinase/ATPase [Chloroflexia bacterium]|nr:RIO1 family regulatory kinase/ATPase [Chloroflexia bacterium]